MSSSEPQLKEMIGVVLAYARLDFTQKANLVGESDLMDSLASGINMLGEELQASTLSLQEKEIMLKEIHHRVKNNLQIISSLLRLQSQFSTEPFIIEKFEECQSRIRSMAILHEKLYSSNNLKHVELNDYIDTVGKNIIDSNNAYAVRFEFFPADSNFYFDMDHLLPVGLIINELISNALKHGLVSISDPKIALTVSSDDDFISIAVHDNGIGMNSNIDLNQSSTLGLQLVKSLTEQIDGKIEFVHQNGLKVILHFPKH